MLEITTSWCLMLPTLTISSSISVKPLMFSRFSAEMEMIFSFSFRAMPFSSSFSWLSVIRSDLFRTSLSVFLTYMIVYVSMLLLQDGSLDNFSTTFATYLAGSSILLLLAFPIIFVYEKVFGVLTHLSLL